MMYLGTKGEISADHGTKAALMRTMPRSTSNNYFKLFILSDFLALVTLHHVKVMSELGEHNPRKLSTGLSASGFTLVPTKIARNQYLGHRIVLYLYPIFIQEDRRPLHRTGMAF